MRFGKAFEVEKEGGKEPWKAANAPGREKEHL